MNTKPPQEKPEDVRIISFCSPEVIRTFSFSKSFGTYARYKSIYTRRESLEKLASKNGTNVAVAVDPTDTIIGFTVMDTPEDPERWAAVGRDAVIQIKSLEVTRKMRSKGIAPALLTELLADPAIENKILILVAYSWTWDLEGTGKSVPAYRNKLISLYSEFGFKEYPTNDPNVCIKPENLFMARIGSRIGKETKNRFKWACFGQTP